MTTNEGFNRSTVSSKVSSISLVVTNLIDIRSRSSSEKRSCSGSARFIVAIDNRHMQMLRWVIAILNTSSLSSSDTPSGSSPLLKGSSTSGLASATTTFVSGSSRPAFTAESNVCEITRMMGSMNAPLLKRVNVPATESGLRCLYLLPRKCRRQPMSTSSQVTPAWREMLTPKLEQPLLSTRRSISSKVENRSFGGMCLHSSRTCAGCLHAFIF